jgi:hypothetical protein
MTAMREFAGGGFVARTINPPDIVKISSVAG